MHEVLNSFFLFSEGINTALILPPLKGLCKVGTVNHCVEGLGCLVFKGSLRFVVFCPQTIPDF